MNTTLERIYSALPVGLQHIACSAEGLRVTWMRFGGEFDHVLSAAAGGHSGA
jgi:hypothetical protein